MQRQDDELNPDPVAKSGPGFGKEWGKKMSVSWREAAIEALQGHGASDVAEVLARIERLRLHEVTGPNPMASVGAGLYAAIRDGDPRVRMVSPGCFEHTGLEDDGGSTKSLARLENIDLRDVWSDEARDFTPWLLGNADRLGEILGLDIELEGREHPVGTFSLDLIGRDLTNGCVLIVENQLADTDHRHLGQLLTYAAGTDAATVVWVAPRFRDEHRKALDYLNDRTNDGARFFGVEVSVVRIGDSQPAPIFTLAAKPSEWRARIAATQASAELTERREQYRLYWTRYLETVHSRHPGLTNIRSASTRNWTYVNYLRKGIQISLAFLSQSRAICEVYIDLGDAERNSGILRELMKHRADVESAVGEPLQWDDVPLKRACRIRVTTAGEVSNESDHGRLIGWMIDHQIRMKDSIKPLVDALPISMWASRLADEDEDSE
jgi:hypothetical protein